VCLPLIWFTDYYRADTQACPSHMLERKQRTKNLSEAGIEIALEDLHRVSDRSSFRGTREKGGGYGLYV
jgi:hypothetical protein